jgi:anti-sigma factor RsiW
VTGRDDWVSETELQAYLDGELDDGRARAVEVFIADHAEEAARLRSYRRQMAMLRRAYRPLLERPIPPTLPRTLQAQATPASGKRGIGKLAAMAAACLLLLAASAASGCWLRGMAPADAPRERAFMTDAVAAHLTYAVEVRHPVEVGRDQEDHLVTWLSRRLGVRLTAPDLKAHGWELVGGRLLPASIGPAAQFMYQDATGQRVTLYVRAAADPEETAFRFAWHDPLSAFYWREGGAAWALLGELPRSELLGLAHAVYGELNS